MVSFERITECLEKPELDDRSYRDIRLANKLEVLLVHDPATDKASAAMDVNVGNFSDPADMPGMAHLVGRLLSMGSEKYPNENDYRQYLTAYSGSWQANTTATETNYFFEISTDRPDGLSNPNGSVDGTAATVKWGTAETSTNGTPSPLYGALDRLAQFFIAPLFLESTLDRELRAMDSEHKLELRSDPLRLMQLKKYLCNPAHPYHRFSTGNPQTLKEEPTKRALELRSKIIEFYKRHYSSNRMKLVVLGGESLDEMERWVIKLFSGVKNKDLPQNRWDDVQPWLADDMRKQIFAEPVMDIRSMDIYFPFLDEEHLYESQPSRYISHLIRHKGPGSIFAHIKGKGWAHSLSAFVAPVCPGSAVFTVSVELTQEGLRQYCEVAKVVFEYIAMIKEREPEQWIFDEMKNLAELEFRFQQKASAIDFTSRLSSVMQKPLPREWLLSGSLLRTYNPDLIKKALSYLRPDNFRMIIVSQDYPGTWDSKEKWYKTGYKVENIPRDFMADIQQALETTPDTRRPDLHMPHKNEFVPTRLSVGPGEFREVFLSGAVLNDWDSKFDRVPKATICVTLASPVVHETLIDLVMTRFCCELVKDALVEYLYDATLAGLTYELSPCLVGLHVSVDGYSDKVSVLLEKVLTSMRDLTVNLNRFRIAKERLARDYKNAEYRQPFHQVDDYIHYLTSEKTWLNEQYAEKLEHIEPEYLSSFFSKLLRENYLKVLAQGHLCSADDVLSVKRHLGSRCSLDRPIGRRSLIIPQGSNFIYEHLLKDPDNVYHCIGYCLFLGSETDEELKSKLLLFAQMTHYPVLDQLRRPGYRVWSGGHNFAATIRYQLTIQSEHPAKYLESRIDRFLSSFRFSLQDMTEEKFAEHRDIVIRECQKKTKRGDLEHIRDLEAVRKQTKADIVEFYNQYIDPASPTRRKLSVHLNAQSGTHVAPMDVQEQPIREQAQQSLGPHPKHLALEESTANGVNASRQHPVRITNVTRFKAVLDFSLRGEFYCRGH